MIITRNFLPHPPFAHELMLRSLNTYMIDKRTLIAVFSGIILVGFICALLWVNYSSQIRLHDSATLQMVSSIDKQARSFGYFFSERRIDIKDLAEAREIHNFFENKALGMSMEYGLRASLIQIENRFDRLILDRKINGQAVYRALMFIDKNGGVLVNRGNGALNNPDREHMLEHIKPDHKEPMVMSCRKMGELYVLVCMAYQFKGGYAGQILARINTEDFCGNMVSGETADSKKQYYVDWGGGRLGTCTMDAADLPSYVIASIRPDETIRFTMKGAGHKKVDMIAVKETIPETPFSIVATAPVSAIWGSARPIELLIAMGGIAFLTVGALGFLWIMNANTLILKTRLNEENIRKREIEQKNAELEAYRNTLEDQVKQRTRELEDTQRELVHQAMEAGRAQLAAMTLHNIGNAITPVLVYTEMLSGREDKQTLGYLSECYEDLFSHKENLGAYVTSDPRGTRVAAYMKTLIDTLLEQKAKNGDIMAKIMSGVSYMAQVLTLQQSYAPEQVDMKENVNLNILVTDALNMQESTLALRGIRLNIVFSPDIPALMIEKNKLMQVVINLIKNSCDALTETVNNREKVIGITTYQSEGLIGMTLEDSGVGVTPEKIEDIFTMGVSSKGSSGFGLYYCKSFVEANNGSLTLTSPGTGQGTAVTMEFRRNDCKRDDNVEETVSCQMTSEF